MDGTHCHSNSTNRNFNNIVILPNATLTFRHIALKGVRSMVSAGGCRDFENETRDMPWWVILLAHKVWSHYAYFLRFFISFCMLQAWEGAWIWSDLDLEALLGWFGWILGTLWLLTTSIPPVVCFLYLSIEAIRAACDCCWFGGDSLDVLLVISNKLFDDVFGYVVKLSHVTFQLPHTVSCFYINETTRPQLSRAALKAQQGCVAVSE